MQRILTEVREKQKMNFPSSSASSLVTENKSKHHQYTQFIVIHLNRMLIEIEERKPFFIVERSQQFYIWTYFTKWWRHFLGNPVWEKQ